MPISPARNAAFAALMAVERGAWSAEALAAKSTHLDSRDAGLASDILFGTLRHRGELDALIALLAHRTGPKLDPPVRIALEMAIYQLRFLDRIPAHAALNDSVELVRRSGKASAAALVNAVLRNYTRQNLEVPETASTPPWIYDRWVKNYGLKVAQSIAHASLQPPERFIRVNPAQTPPEGAEPTEIPGGFVLQTGDPGPFRFQDLGSQAVVPLLDLQNGQTFLDLCAAPGNKTAQALETPDLHAIACDIHLSRAHTLTVLGIPTIVLDASQPLPFDRTFDRILVDAPCTGTGTLARNPEIKHRLKPADLKDLAARQTAILRNALKALKPGGVLVYSTCSLEPEENLDVVVAVTAATGAKLLKKIHRLPGRERGDGFFAAALTLPAPDIINRSAPC
jgi:16S rRNA (cytosine967-C5)-methyltransferase